MTGRNTSRRDRDRTILARHHPACAICGQPIDYRLKSPHPDSFEADHIVPLALGGTDTLDNKQPAHRRCNSAKRARLSAPIIRRSGSLN